MRRMSKRFYFDANACDRGIGDKSKYVFYASSPIGVSDSLQA
jgi:hypothetical protein